MLDKIPSIKDFIIYLMPGILICYFGLNCFNHFLGKPITICTIAENALLSFVGIVFSFMVGFLMSQLQIIAYNQILKPKFIKMRTIKGAISNESLRATLIDRIISEFGINTDRNKLENDDLIVFACLNFVIIYTNAEGLVFVSRSNNLSSFAMTLMMPIFMGVFNLLLLLQFSGWQIAVILVIALSLIYAITRKIILNFRGEYYISIFRQFMILSNVKK
jgi:hypothetical protein